jgi:hypothetical protein
VAERRAEFLRVLRQAGRRRLMLPLSSPLYTIGSGSTAWNGNARDDSGCDWIVTNPTGWSASPPARPSQQDKTIGDGAHAGTGYYAGRLVILEGTCVAPDQVSMLWAKEAINSAFGPYDLVPLRVDELHLSRMCMVRLNDQIDPIDKGPVAFTWQFGVFAPDPRRYSVNPVSLSCGLPTAGTGNGRTYPRTYPLLYSGAGAGASEVVFMQAGNYKYTPAVITIQGPVISPTVEHDRSGSHLTLDMTIGYGRYVVLDLNNQTAMLGGTQTVATSLTSDSAWFMLSPGENVLAFRGEAGANPDGSPGSPVMTVAGASAWV